MLWVYRNQIKEAQKRKKPQKEAKINTTKYGDDDPRFFDLVIFCFYRGHPAFRGKNPVPNAQFFLVTELFNIKSSCFYRSFFQDE